MKNKINKINKSLNNIDEFINQYEKGQILTLKSTEFTKLKNNIIKGNFQVEGMKLGNKDFMTLFDKLFDSLDAKGKNITIGNMEYFYSSFKRNNKLQIILKEDDIKYILDKFQGFYNLKMQNNQYSNYFKEGLNSVIQNIISNNFLSYDYFENYSFLDKNIYFEQFEIKNNQFIIDNINDFQKIHNKDEIINDVYKVSTKNANIFINELKDYNKVTLLGVLALNNFQDLEITFKKYFSQIVSDVSLNNKIFNDISIFKQNDYVYNFLKNEVYYLVKDFFDNNTNTFWGNFNNIETFLENGGNININKLLNLVDSNTFFSSNNQNILDNDNIKNIIINNIDDIEEKYRLYIYINNEDDVLKNKLLELNDSNITKLDGIFSGEIKTINEDFIVHILNNNNNNELANKLLSSLLNRTTISFSLINKIITHGSFKKISPENQALFNSKLNSNLFNIDISTLDSKFFKLNLISKDVLNSIFGKLQLNQKLQLLNKINEFSINEELQNLAIQLFINDVSIQQTINNIINDGLDIQYSMNSLKEHYFYGIKNEKQLILNFFTNVKGITGKNIDIYLKLLIQKKDFKSILFISEIVKTDKGENLILLNNFNSFINENLDDIIKTIGGTKSKELENTLLKILNGKGDTILIQDLIKIKENNENVFNFLKNEYFYKYKNIFGKKKANILYLYLFSIEKDKIEFKNKTSKLYFNYPNLFDLSDSDLNKLKDSKYNIVLNDFDLDLILPTQDYLPQYVNIDNSFIKINSINDFWEKHKSLLLKLDNNSLSAKVKEFLKIKVKEEGLISIFNKTSIKFQKDFIIKFINDFNFSKEDYSIINNLLNKKAFEVEMNSKVFYIVKKLSQNGYYGPNILNKLTIKNRNGTNNEKIEQNIIDNNIKYIIDEYKKTKSINKEEFLNSLFNEGLIEKYINGDLTINEELIHFIQKEFLDFNQDNKIFIMKLLIENKINEIDKIKIINLFKKDIISIYEIYNIINNTYHRYNKLDEDTLKDYLKQNNFDLDNIKSVVTNEMMGNIFKLNSNFKQFFLKNIDDYYDNEKIKLQLCKLINETGYEYFSQNIFPIILKTLKDFGGNIIQLKEKSFELSQMYKSLYYKKS